ncbi:MAG: hypothetical protein LPK12_10735 [Rhodobacterales bacterium]|nr:hypothetical protein [Rhodobacterales bacterium]MDX5500426.1 hypothetical protein [Rhodobacterales bacterium]
MEVSPETVCARKVTAETWIDLNQNGTFNTNDLVRSVTVDGAGNRLTEEWDHNTNGSFNSKSTSTINLAGTNRQTTVDADGDGDTDTAVSDITTVFSSGVSRQVIETRNQDSSLRTKVQQDRRLASDRSIPPYLAFSL